MRKLISLTMVLSLVFSGVKTQADSVVKLPAKRMHRVEPMNNFQSSSISGHANYVDNDRNSFENLPFFVRHVLFSI